MLLGGFRLWPLSPVLSQILNIKKTKYTLFFKSTKADDIPFKLSNLLINNTPIERQTSMKFLGVLLDENLSWRSHIQTIEIRSLKISLCYIKSNHY